MERWGGSLKRLFALGMLVLSACTSKNPFAPSDELIAGNKTVIEMYNEWLSSNGFFLEPNYIFTASIGVEAEIYAGFEMTDDSKEAIENLVNMIYVEMGPFMSERFGIEFPSIKNQPFAGRQLRVVILPNDNCLNRVNLAGVSYVPYSIIVAEEYEDCGTNASSLTPINSNGDIYPTSFVIVGNLPQSTECMNNSSILCTGDPRICECLTDGQLFIAGLAHEIAENYINLTVGGSDEGGKIEETVTAFERYILYLSDEEMVDVLDRMYLN